MRVIPSPSATISRCVCPSLSSPLHSTVSSLRWSGRYVHNSSNTAKPYGRDGCRVWVSQRYIVYVHNVCMCSDEFMYVFCVIHFVCVHIQCERMKTRQRQMISTALQMRMALLYLLSIGLCRVAIALYTTLSVKVVPRPVYSCILSSP